MAFGRVLQRFADVAPVCVMARRAMERAMGADALDQLFRDTAARQYERELLFSGVVGLMAQVACGARRSVHEAYQHAADPPAVSLASVYNKLNGVEPGVSAALVRHAAGAVGPLVRLMRQDRPSPLPGYDVRVVDGDHLAGTDHRIKELRTTRSAALPGQALAVLDPAARLILDLVPCENAHAQERALVEQLFASMTAGQVWVADRNFCTTRMLFGAIRAGAYFVIRQHASTLHWRELGPFRPCGRADTGRVSEQDVEVSDPLAGERVTVRRVRLELDEPTEDGEAEILLLTNLPADGGRAVSAKQVAGAYRGRWRIEHAFQDLAVALRGEVDTLGYPRAALFAFAVAAAAYNLVALVLAALGAVHGPEKVEAGVSTYHLAREWATTYEGMAIAVGPRAWAAYPALDDPAFVAVLKELAAAADLRKYRKARRGPKKKRPPRTSGSRIHHVATAKLLDRRKLTKTAP
jgi:hypothetical protein